ncbi:hypothetical protein F8388_007390 [Cannabis sativa]|uniref:Uncharacterized protein n=1 Tax=Cannabis sativa TaxID=3483 RepID=A0A7J6DQX6_CANSA|nr:hypothetical protein F8388_007390 [Cannabis sativa]
MAGLSCFSSSNSIRSRFDLRLYLIRFQGFLFLSGGLLIDYDGLILQIVDIIGHAHLKQILLCTWLSHLFYSRRFFDQKSCCSSSYDVHGADQIRIYLPGMGVWGDWGSGFLEGCIRYRHGRSMRVLSSDSSLSSDLCHDRSHGVFARGLLSGVCALCPALFFFLIFVYSHYDCPTLLRIETNRMEARIHRNAKQSYANCFIWRLLKTVLSERSPAQLYMLASCKFLDPSMAAKSKLFDMKRSLPYPCFSEVCSEF